MDSQLAQYSDNELAMELKQRVRARTQKNTQPEAIDPDTLMLIECSTLMQRIVQLYDCHVGAVMSAGGTAVTLGRSPETAAIGVDDNGSIMFDKDELKKDSTLLRRDVQNWFAIRHALHVQLEYVQSCCDSITQTLDQHGIELANLVDKTVRDTPRVGTNVETVARKIKDLFKAYNIDAIVGMFDETSAFGFCVVDTPCTDAQHPANATEEGLSNSLVVVNRLNQMTTRLNVQTQQMLHDLRKRATQEGRDPDKLVVAKDTYTTPPLDNDALEEARRRLADYGYSSAHLPTADQVDPVAKAVGEMQEVLGRHDVGAVVSVASSRYARTVESIPRSLQVFPGDHTKCGFPEGASEQQIREGMLTIALMVQMSVQAAERAHDTLAFLTVEAERRGVKVDTTTMPCPMCEEEEEEEEEEIFDDKSLN